MAKAVEQLTNEDMGRLLMATSRLMHRASADLAELNMTPPQMGALATLATVGELTMSQLSFLLGLALPTTTGIVDRLTRAGLVQRRRDAEDRRVVKVAITGSGRGRLDKSIELRRRTLVAMIEEMDAEPAADLVVLIKRLCELLGPQYSPFRTQSP
ncbi:MAG: MarR family transcriptional regulator [Actinobacteria bacterium]|nr:MAG: MarR family transcriptional regulator [Actinomycetota bacterium]